MYNTNAGNNCADMWTPYSLFLCDILIYQAVCSNYPLCQKPVPTYLRASGKFLLCLAYQYIRHLSFHLGPPLHEGHMQCTSWKITIILGGIAFTSWKWFIWQWKIVPGEFREIQCSLFWSGDWPKPYARGSWLYFFLGWRQMVRWCFLLEQPRLAMPCLLLFFLVM